MRYTSAVGPRRPATTLTRAFALFVVVCGLVLVTLGPGGRSDRRGEPSTAAGKLAFAIDNARVDITAAEAAIEQANYGEASHKLRQAQGKLSKAVTSAVIEDP